MDGKEMCALLKQEAQKGNICFFATPDELVKVNLDEFIRQPAEGMLYDLNRNKITVLHFITQGNMKWVNNYAVALVIEKLREVVGRTANKTLETTQG